MRKSAVFGKEEADNRDFMFKMKIFFGLFVYLFYQAIYYSFTMWPYGLQKAFFGLAFYSAFSIVPLILLAGVAKGGYKT